MRHRSSSFFGTIAVTICFSLGSIALGDIAYSSQEGPILGNLPPPEYELPDSIPPDEYPTFDTVFPGLDSVVIDSDFLDIGAVIIDSLGIAPPEISAQPGYEPYEPTVDYGASIYPDGSAAVFVYRPGVYAVKFWHDGVAAGEVFFVYHGSFRLPTLGCPESCQSIMQFRDPFSYVFDLYLYATTNPENEVDATREAAEETATRTGNGAQAIGVANIGDVVTAVNNAFIASGRRKQCVYIVDHGSPQDQGVGASYLRMLAPGVPHPDVTLLCSLRDKIRCLKLAGCNVGKPKDGQLALLEYLMGEDCLCLENLWAHTSVTTCTPAFLWFPAYFDVCKPGHTQDLPPCPSHSAAEARSWGCIKSLYR